MFVSLAHEAEKSPFIHHVFQNNNDWSTIYDEEGVKLI